MTYEEYRRAKMRAGRRFATREAWEKSQINLNKNIMTTEQQNQTDDRALVNKIIEFRKEISELLNTLGSKGLLPSREMSLAKTDCQRAFHHLGLQLKAMNEKNPYPESTNTDSKVVEPIADAVYSELPLRGTTQLERVKELRGHVQNIIDKYDKTELAIGERDNFVTSQFWLIEVKMWLGWELGRIRDQRDADNAPKSPIVQSETIALY